MKGTNKYGRPKIKPRLPRFKLTGQQAPPPIEEQSSRALVEGINYLLQELRERGVRVCDWESKEREIREVRMLWNKAYFFAADPERRNEENGNEDP